MKRNNFILSILCLISILSFTACSIPSSSSGFWNLSVGSITLTSTEKTAFAETCRQIATTKDADEEEITNLLIEAAFSSDEERANVNQQLEAYGIYNFSGSEKIEEATNGDVILNKPSFYYNANSGQWIVICSGYWDSKDWMSYKDEVGTADSFGVRLTCEDDSYSSSVVDAYAFIADKDLSEFVSTQNRSDGDGAKGFTFTLQDYTSNSSHGKLYVGTRWFGMCVYDANFEDYNCTATAFYEHTD